MEIQLKRDEDKKLEVFVEGEKVKFARSIEVKATAHGSSQIKIDLVDIPFNLTFCPKDVIFRNISTGVEYVLQERWRYLLNVELYQLLGDILSHLKEDPKDMGDRLLLQRVKDILIPYLHGRDSE